MKRFHLDLQSIALRVNWCPLSLAFILGAVFAATYEVSSTRSPAPIASVSAEAAKVCHQGSVPNGARFRILASYESRSLCESPGVAAQLHEFEKRSGVDLEIVYVGGNELAGEMKAGGYDAYLVPDQITGGLPRGANGQGDKVIPIGRTPVVLAVRGQELRDKLNTWGNRISPRRLMELTNGNVINPAMSPPSQLSSGTLLFHGLLDRLGDISQEDKIALTTFLKETRTERISSTEIAESLAKSPQNADSFVGTEADVVQLNRTLISRKVSTEELYRVVYVDTYAPTLSLVVPAESLAEQGKTRTVVHEFERTIESHQFRRAITQVGVRPKREGFEVFVPYLEPLPEGGSSDLGFDSNVPLETDAPEVKELHEVVQVYHEARPGSLIIAGLDYSGSMVPYEHLMEEALRQIFDPERAAELLLTIKEQDVRGALPFSTQLRAKYRAVGPAQSQSMVDAIIREQNSAGNTAYYATVVDAYKEIARERANLGESGASYRAVIIAMTDGKDTRGGTPQQVLDIREALNMQDVLLVQIAFGEADTAAMKKLAADTNGVFCLGDTASLKSCFVRGIGSGS